MPPNITHIAASTYQDIPWPDGGSSTTELVRFPFESDPKSPFLWQLNLTRRESKGEFGKFPGYERFILQLSGKTITLHHAQKGDQKLTPLVPYAFKADLPTRRGLVGKAEDLNFFVRSERLSAKFERIDLKDRKPLSKQLAHYTIVWAYQGSVELECAGEKTVIKERETLVIESDDELEFILKSKRALLFVISVGPKFKG